jgi:hypothetical protein
MKQLVACVLILISILPVTVEAANIYVATNGSDVNAGTLDAPFASVAMALRKAREMRRLNDPSITNGIHIILGGGVYSFYEPLFVRPEDTGTKDSPTYIEAAANEQPVFSGGIPITGWHLLKEKVPGLPNAAKGKIWEADVPAPNGVPLNFRQLWVNDVKATRAKDRNSYSMNRILSWDHTTGECWIPTPKTPDLVHATSLEMFIHQWWAIAVLRVKKIEVHGDSSKLSFYQPESKVQNEHPWPAPWISTKTGNSAFYLTNAIQLLDEPGEWHLDVAHSKLYYYPKPGENITTATVVAPTIETLVEVSGTIDRPVSNIIFKGISFEHTSWLRPSLKGHVPLQAGMFLLDAYKLKQPGTPEKKGLENQAWIGRQPAAVLVKYGDDISFIGCRFEHLAATGLDIYKGTHNDAVTGCLFYDIGGTGIQAGVYSDEAIETHLPYNPTDERELCDHLNISNNLVTNVSNEDWGCVGISAGYVRNININHNEVNDVSYSGICVGWGWTKVVNAMRNNSVSGNKVHHYAKHMYDAGGIYTLSTQPGTMIEVNVVDSIYKAPYAHDPEHWFYYYLDEGSSYMTVRNNRCPKDKTLRNANGPGVTWENNGPDVADSIKASAGLQAPYRYLLQLVPVTKNKWPVNQ